MVPQWKPLACSVCKQTACECQESAATLRSRLARERSREQAARDSKRVGKDIPLRGRGASRAGDIKHSANERAVGKLNVSPRFVFAVTTGVEVRFTPGIFYCLQVSILPTQESNDTFRSLLRRFQCFSLETGVEHTYLLVGSVRAAFLACYRALQEATCKAPRVARSTAPNTRTKLLTSAEFLLTGSSVRVNAVGAGGGEGYRPKPVPVPVTHEPGSDIPPEEAMSEWERLTGRKHVPGRKLGAGERETRWLARVEQDK
jgi:hypothetical protein